MAEVGKDITEYLKEFHTTEGKAIKARELCVLFNVHQKQLRNIVSDLRQNGEAICSSTYGYWYSRDPDDISTTLSRLVGQRVKFSRLSISDTTRSIRLITIFRPLKCVLKQRMV